MSLSFVLTAEELRAISAHAQTRAFPRNAVILNEGDRTDSLYIIVEGRVKAFVSDPEGKEVVLSTQGAGEYFGEMVLDEGPRSASIMTLEPSRFLVVPKNDFKDFLLKNPAFAVRVIEKLIDRARAHGEREKPRADGCLRARRAPAARARPGARRQSGDIRAAHPEGHREPCRRLARDGEPDPERPRDRRLHPPRWP